MEPRKPSKRSITWTGVNEVAGLSPGHTQKKECMLYNEEKTSAKARRPEETWRRERSR